MRNFKLLSVVVMLIMVLAACQSGGGIEAVDMDSSSTSEQVEGEDKVETVETETEEMDTPENVSVEDDSVSTEEDNEQAEEKASEEASEETSEEAVAQFPVRDEKIPPYEIELRDGSVIKLDQFEGQVVMMTFFTTW